MPSPNNTRRLLAACQGINFRCPLKTSDLLEQAKAELRILVPLSDQDHYFSLDIETAAELIREGALEKFVTEVVKVSA